MHAVRARRGSASLGTALVVAAFGAACGGDSTDAARSVEVRDSAGVRIVHQGERPDSLVWRTLELVWEIGFDESVRFFDGIRAGALLSDGRAVVADFGARELVIVGREGTVDDVLGGEGQGPGEFRTIWSMTRMAGDTLLIEDSGNQRISLWRPSGPVGTYPRDRRALGLLTVRGSLGGRLVMSPSGAPGGFEEPWYRGPIALRAPTSEMVDTIAWYDAAENLGESSSPFRAWGRVSTTDDTLILVARGDRPEVRLLNDRGEIRTIVRWTETPEPVTEDLLQAYTRWLADGYGWDAERAASLLEGLREGAPELRPMIGTLLGDSEGRTWVTGYDMKDQHDRFWVFDGEGRPLGWALLPPGTRVLDIRDDLLLASVENELGVEAAALYRLVTAG